VARIFPRALRSPFVADSIRSFAYGSNLHHARIMKRVGRLPQADRGRLFGYRLAFNKRAQGGGVYGNLVPAPGHEAWGVVYHITAAELEILDSHEGVSTGHYSRDLVEIALDDGARCRAFAYFACPDHIVPEGQPSPEYLNHIVTGAAEQGLPPAYIEQVNRRASGLSAT
jgi:gamma-glutamylcyclotransferase